MRFPCIFIRAFSSHVNKIKGNCVKFARRIPLDRFANDTFSEPSALRAPSNLNDATYAA